MAGVVKRKNTWFATWTGFDGRTVMRSTKIKVVSVGKTEKQTRKLAKQTADAMEQVAKGITSVDKAKEALDSIAVLCGFAKPVPTIEEYLNSFPELSRPKTEHQRKVSFRGFLEWLGKDAKLPITRITPEHIRGHFIWLLQNYSTGTVDRRRQNLACAFNRAVNIDRHLTHSPMKAVQLTQVMKSLGVKDDSVARVPFTADEMKTILNRFPQPYCDLASVSFYTGGLRLGDVCMLRWADVDFEQNSIAVREQKTDRPRLIHLLPQLRERLLARKEQVGGGEYVFPETAVQYLRSASPISSGFSSLLNAFGIRDGEENNKELKGHRRKVATKSFHSIRHSVVSWARSNPNLSPDVVRETVGHGSDDIEMKYYFTAEDKAKLAVLESVAQMVEPDVEPTTYANLPLPPMAG